MTRYFIDLSFDGTRYHGWQIQPNGNSVQAELQRALSLLHVNREPVEVVGAGRTDAGVHARCMIAHFDWEQPIDDPSQMIYRLNRILPHDITVNRVYQVKSGMHARFSALQRTYHYYIHQGKKCFHNHYSVETNWKIDFELMNKGAAYLTRLNDFKAFCKTKSDAKTTLCTVSEARWIEIEPGRWCFIITANRFLRNMVRAVVGTLIELGRGKLSYEEFCQIAKNGTRCDAGESMPAKGLFLWDIKYNNNE